MSSVKVVLLSGNGITTSAIVGVLPKHFDIKTVNISSENILQTLKLESKTLSFADIIILNLSDITLSSKQILSRIKLLSEAPIIVLHYYQEKTFIDAFINMGASAYLPINFNPATILSTINSFLKENQTDYRPSY